jgi:hypothetical protein
MQRATSGSFRLLCWLGFGLVLAASTPHVHPADMGPVDFDDALASSASPAAPIAVCPDPAVGATLSPDENHAEHSGQILREGPACRLCRSCEEEPVIRISAFASRAGAVLRDRSASVTPNHVASVFASLYPARAPPGSFGA